MLNIVVDFILSISGAFILVFAAKEINSRKKNHESLLQDINKSKDTISLI
ncbi:hypothetical protein SAMN02745912_03271 [Paramaledivibacter caminithermalis DSM 15212]|jgi:hypothetical protein|uniref:Uncharacterized protein n=2 Tax=Paramaledivibacter TaxID=1884934 RepID=A0A1M6SDC5_PARC5|nr:hypothetical protein SAMN02745912_03271 [Paramaledivibacter caminithermalis DSM 15212]